MMAASALADPALPTPATARLRPAPGLPAERAAGRLLAIRPRAGEGEGQFFETTVTALPELLLPGDLVVVNDAATVPASLFGQDPRGRPLEARLIAQEQEGPPSVTFAAVLLGAGAWRTRTEDRPPPPITPTGTRLEFGNGALVATVAAVSPRSPRLVTLRFEAERGRFWAALYRIGRPVQ